MGGRGASSGVSIRKMPNGEVKKFKYGSEYHTVLEVDNIKFVKSNDPNNIHTAPMETMTKNRVYVYVDDNNVLKNIVFFDKNNLRRKSIDLDHIHVENGVVFKDGHVHIGYFHDEYGTFKLSAKEIKMVERVNNVWYNHTNK